jgi:transposase
VGRGRTKEEYFWALARDDRPRGGTDLPAIASATRLVAVRFMRSSCSMVIAVSCAAYKSVAENAPSEAFTLVFCWAHLRRRFFDIAKGGDAPIASTALECIAALYAVEKTIRGRSAEERRAVRQDSSKPLLAALKA